MPAARPPRALLTALAALALAAAACGHNSTTDFPLEVGFQPLEPLVPEALPPAPAAGDDHPEGLGTIISAPGAGYYAAHARGYLHQPLARVYQALHDPAASFIHNDGGRTRLAFDPTMDVEPFPVSFRVRYESPTGIITMPTVQFDVTYRAGPLEGTEAAPVRIGQRYQKTWGIANIHVMAGSLVASEVAPGVTEVEMIAWLNATSQYQSDCNGTVADLFGDLQRVAAALP